MLLFRPFLSACISALILALFVSGCGGSTQGDKSAEEAAVPKIDPPEVVLRNFYAALDSESYDSETTGALLSKRSGIGRDPKSGSLVGSTHHLIQNNGGIAKFNVLNVGQEMLVTEQRADLTTEELRTVVVDYEIIFNNGESRHSRSRLIYEQIEKPAEAGAEAGTENTPTTAGGAAPAEFGWRVEAVNHYIEEK